MILSATRYLILQLLSSAYFFINGNKYAFTFYKHKLLSRERWKFKFDVSLLTAAGRHLQKTTHESIPCILTESCSSLKNCSNILRSSCSGTLGMSLIMSFRTIAATLRTWGISSWETWIYILNRRDDWQFTYVSRSYWLPGLKLAYTHGINCVAANLDW